MHRHCLGLAFVCLLGAQEAPRRPAGTAQVDGAVFNIPRYNRAAQAPPSDDGEFLRRVMFDLVGYPPTGAQVKAFLADPSPAKRAAVVDRLLASDDFADYWSRLFAEVYFGNYHDVPMETVPAMSKTASARIVKDFLKWFKLKLQKDAPYTEIVTQMLEASGPDAGDPAIAYKLSFYKGDGVPLEFADGASRHLLGIRLACARCHDSPYDRWITADFYGLADFIFGQRAETLGGTDPADAVRLTTVNNGNLQQPNGAAAAPELLGIAMPAGAGDRMTSLATIVRTTPQFAQAVVNRVWSWLLGRGVFHPVDDQNLKNPPISRGLLAVLTREFVVNKHSLKHLVRLICATDAYQRSCHSPAAYTRVDFSRATIKPLNGNQLVNALRVATGGQPTDDVPAMLEMIGGLFPAGAAWCETTPLPGRVDQALLVRNNRDVLGWIDGPVLAAIKSGSGTVEEKVDEMFLAALSRKPEPAERARYAAWVEGHPLQGFEDAYWTLLNSAEFLTRH